MSETTDSLEKIASEVSACQKCKLHATRKKAVPGDGPAAGRQRVPFSEKDIGRCPRSVQNKYKPFEPGRTWR